MLKLNKSHSIGQDLTIRSTLSGLITDSLVVTLYHLSNDENKDGKKKKKLPMANPSLLFLSIFDLREGQETNCREIYWPYTIKDVDINPIN